MIVDYHHGKFYGRKKSNQLYSPLSLQQEHAVFYTSFKQFADGLPTDETPSMISIKRM